MAAVGVALWLPWEVLWLPWEIPWLPWEVLMAAMEGSLSPSC